MFADILNMEIQTVDSAELGALGAAIVASVAAGIYPNLTAASQAMVRVGKIYTPNRQYRVVYDQKYNEFCNVVRTMRPLWAQFG